MKDGKIEQQPDASRKVKDYGSTQTGKAKMPREELQGQQLEFLVWRLLEVSFHYISSEMFRLQLYVTVLHCSADIVVIL